MNVQLLTSEQSFRDLEQFAALAALTCHANAEKKHVPSDVLKRIIKAGHESILEHITLTYSVKELSRACLQELARHRHISLSVESTRHTLRKSIKEHFGQFVNQLSGEMLHVYFQLKDVTDDYPDMPNDELKYFLPEFWPTNLILTANIRELRHILNLRTAPAALKEFRNLARELFLAVPEKYRYLLEDCVHEEINT